MDKLNLLKGHLDSNKIFLFIAIAIYSIVYLGSIHDPFFWDTIQLASLHANFFYSTNFSSIILPEEIDSGHIPFFGMYIALGWKVFGRSLLVSHMMMLPWAIGFIIYLVKLLKIEFKQGIVGIVILLIILDPTILGQLRLVSPDVVLMACFTLAWYALLDNKRVLFSVAIFGLFLISMRGMMVAFALFLFDTFLYYKKKPRFWDFTAIIKRYVVYFPAIFLFFVYFGYHYIETGWVGFHKDSSWNESFEPVGIKGIIKNVVIFAWRILDFGRIGMWLVLILILLFYNKSINKKIYQLNSLVLSVSLIVVLGGAIIWANGLMGHRYLMPIYLGLSVFVAKLLLESNLKKNIINLFLVLWIGILASGNFWVYPNKIAQGWDSTPAHWPYWELRSDAITYLKSNNIPVKSVSSFFPNIRSFNDIDLNGDDNSFIPFTRNEEYIFYSNIFNIDDSDYDYIFDEYELVKRFEKVNVFVEILKSKD